MSKSDMSYLKVPATKFKIIIVKCFICLNLCPSNKSDFLVSRRMQGRSQKLHEGGKKIFFFQNNLSSCLLS